MKKFIFSGLFFMFLSVVAYSQQKTATISFDDMEHDFGVIKEEAGPASYTFNFTNTGGEPLIISNCKASCGCTTPDWTKNPVLPGKKGFVKATYDPKNRPGKFDKTITVTANTEPATITLRIKGEVKEKQKTEEDLYPQKLGDLRLKSNHMAFVKVFNTQVKTDTMEFYNAGEAPVEIGFSNVPAHLSFKVEPKSIKPKEKGKIFCTYDGTKKNDWGFIMDRIDVTLNGKTDPQYKLSVSATIEEDFTKLTKEQIENAPKIKFDDVNFDFGTIKSGESVSHEYTFKNEGKTDLVIRKVKASCGCTAVEPPSKVIKPGETSSIKTTFNSAGKSGKQNKTITVNTNDPKNYSIILNIKGTIEGDAKGGENKGKPNEKK